MSNVSDHETLHGVIRKVDFYLFVLYPILWTILSIGNVLSLIIFLRPNMRKSHTNVYLAALAVADMVFVNSSSWPNIQDTIQGGRSYNNMRFWAKGRIWQYLLHAGNYVTGWLLVIISADRFIMIQYPMWSKVHATPKKALLFLLTCLPFVIYPMHNLYGRDGPNFVSETYKNFYLNVDIKFVSAIATMIITLLIITFNGLITYKLIEHVRNREKNFGIKEADKSQSASMKITKMLLVVSVLALLLRTPIQLLHIIINAQVRNFELDAFWNSLWHLMLSIGYALSYLNSCLNFFVYISMSSNFKNEFRAVFCSCLKPKNTVKQVVHGASRNKPVENFDVIRERTNETDIPTISKGI